MSIVDPERGRDASASMESPAPPARSRAAVARSGDHETTGLVAERRRSSLREFFFPKLPPIDPNARSTIPSLDGFRAISILLVLIAHAGLGNVIPGGLGVSIFFFLSGYLITTLMRREFLKTGTVDLRKFYIRRSLRILPPCYIVIGVVLILDVALGASFTWTGVLSHVLYVTNYQQVFGLGEGLSGLNVLWSLAVEEHFYLLFPLLYLATVGFRRRTQGVILAAICLLVLAWRCLLVFSFHAPADRIYAATDTRLDSILWGCCFAILCNPALKDRPAKWLAHWSLAALGVGVLVFCLVFRQPWFRESFRYSLQALALMPIFALSIRSFDRGPFRLLNWYPMRLLGLYSYTIYLTHAAVVNGLEHLHIERFLVVFPVMTAVSFVLAAVMYQFVDEPFARIRKRFGT